MSVVNPAEDAGTLVVQTRFAIVPEWVLDADISDGAVRLYAVLLRYGNTSGARMPSRATLATRLRKGSTDTVDRALKELLDLGAVLVEHRRNGRRNLPNRYHLRATPPTTAAARPGAGQGGRPVAARPRTSDREPLPRPRPGHQRCDVGSAPRRRDLRPRRARPALPGRTLDPR